VSGAVVSGAVVSGAVVGRGKKGDCHGTRIDAQAIQLADELKAARASLFELPSCDLESELPYPHAALRTFNGLFKELVDHLPPVDLNAADHDCSFCGADDDHLIYDPEMAEWPTVWCDSCGHILEHRPSSEQDETIVITSGVCP
jgi:hypothetical protein